MSYIENDPRHALAVSMGLDAKYDFFSAWTPPPSHPYLITAYGVKIMEGVLGLMERDFLNDQLKGNSHEPEIEHLTELVNDIQAVRIMAEERAHEQFSNRYTTAEVLRENPDDDRVTMWSEFKIMYVYACLRAAEYPNPEIIYDRIALQRASAVGTDFTNIWRDGARRLGVGLDTSMTPEEVVGLGEKKAREFMWWADKL